MDILTRARRAYGWQILRSHDCGAPHARAGERSGEIRKANRHMACHWQSHLLCEEARIETNRKRRQRAPDDDNHDQHKVQTTAETFKYIAVIIEYYNTYMRRNEMRIETMIKCIQLN